MINDILDLMADAVKARDKAVNAANFNVSHGQAVGLRNALYKLRDQFNATHWERYRRIERQVMAPPNPPKH